MVWKLLEKNKTKLVLPENVLYGKKKFTFVDYLLSVYFNTWLTRLRAIGGVEIAVMKKFG